MWRIYKLQIFFLSILFILPAVGQADSGTTGARILNQPAGARVQAMGEAFTAVADDISALHYNPAGLGSQEQDQISAMYIRGAADVYYGFLGGNYSIGDGTVAVSLMTLQGGEIEINDLDGASQTLKAEQDYLLTMGCGFALGMIPGLYLGLDGKAIRSTLLEEYSASAFAVDFGGYYQTPIEGLSVGLAVQNIGTKMKYQDIEDPLPIKVRQGVAYRFEIDENQNLILALDEINFNQICIGVEYCFSDLLFLRAGFKQSDMVGEDWQSRVWSCGAGVNIEKLHVDYGIRPQGALGLAHYISMTLAL